MKEERRRSREDDVVYFSKKKRTDEAAFQSHISGPKSRGHVPMSERQQFALLRQMECEEGIDRGQSSFPAGAVHSDLYVPGSHLHQQADDAVGTPDSYKSGSLSAHEQLTDNNKSESSASPCSASHRRSMRESPLMPAGSVSAHVSGRFTPIIRSKLFQLSKSNDLDSLKQLIRDGVNVNEQDERGRTVLHEFTIQNLPRFVACLLRHGAQPNLASVDGDTALHEAARAGFTRVIRTLLRHGADPLVLNSHGERPLDVCQDSETLAVLNQYTGNHRSHFTTILMKSTTSSKFQRQHHGQMNTGDQVHSTLGPRPPSCVSFLGGHEGYTYGKSCSTTTTPDCLSDSDDACSSSGLPPATNTLASELVSLYSNENSITSVISTSTTHNASPKQKGSFCEPHSMSYKLAKKDPYAFEDETEDSLHPGPSFHSASAVNPGKSTSPNTRSRAFGSGSACGLCVSNVVSIPSNTNPTFSLSSSLPPCDFNLLAAAGQNGPPLRLRFAKEAGQYTLMENQQGNAASEEDEVSECAGIQLATSSERKEPEIEQTAAVPSSECPVIQVASDAVIGVSDNVEICGASAVRPMSAHETTALESSSDDGCSLQRVPPLRIKFASGTCDSDPPGAGIAASDDTRALSHASPVDDIPSSDDVLANPMQSQVMLTGCSDVSISGDLMSLPGIDPEALDVSAVVSRESDVLTSELFDPLVGSVSATRHPHSQLSAQLSEDFGDTQTDHVDGATDSSKELRHRGGRTLRSHTAAQREREERERHANVTPIKKRKLRSRNDNNPDGPFSSTQSIQQSRNSCSVCTTSSVTVISTSPMMVFGAGEHSDTRETIVSTTELLVKHEPSLREPVCTPKVEPVSPLATIRADNDILSPSMRVSPEPDGVVCALDARSKLVSAPSSLTATVQAKMEVIADEPQKSEHSNTLTCPVSFDDDRRFPQLLEFENPYEKADALQKRLRELVNSLVEVHPKAPSAYEQYLLVSRNYLLAYEIPSLAKKSPPPDLNPVLASLFTEQEEERYAQALKHQSEREHLRLCAEQARLRAQTRAALANVSKPLSFCSVLGFTDLTYVPAVPKAEQREEECAGDRFTQRTFIGWLEDIRDSFQLEKKKLLCRQLHEAESLMMVQRLDWEIKLKGCHVRDYSSALFRNIPPSHVPLIHVPSDFPLFPNDPVLPVELV